MRKCRETGRQGSSTVVSAVVKKDSTHSHYVTRPGPARLYARLMVEPACPVLCDEVWLLPRAAQPSETQNDVLLAGVIGM